MSSCKACAAFQKLCHLPTFFVSKPPSLRKQFCFCTKVYKNVLLKIYFPNSLYNQPPLSPLLVSSLPTIVLLQHVRCPPVIVFFCPGRRTWSSCMIFAPVLARCRLSSYPLLVFVSACCFCLSPPARACSCSKTSAHQMLSLPAPKLMFYTYCRYCVSDKCVHHIILVNLTKFTPTVNWICGRILWKSGP